MASLKRRKTKKGADSALFKRTAVRVSPRALNTDAYRGGIRL
nr:MAG: hypothetical protein [Microvirus sp.]